MVARSELPWSEFFELHVVKKVAKLLNQRWNLGLGYIDIKARKVRPPRRLATTGDLCRCIQDREAGQRACDATAYETARMLAEREIVSAEPITIHCHAGLTEIVAPILIDGKLVGSLLAGGVLGGVSIGDPSRDGLLAGVGSRTAMLALNPDHYQVAGQCHPQLDDRAVEFAAALLAAAAEEIALYHRATLQRTRSPSELESEFAIRYSYDAIIGKSSPMQELYHVLDRVVQSDSTVLIQGENGTGKELVARAIHYNSSRKNRRFVVTNCSAFNDNLLDSELFGHKRGAFTGAIADKQGLFEVADKGTFFLDEIGDMSPTLQVKILRVLQEGTFTPVGDTETRHVDVRIIAATNRNLKGMVDSGGFREDLYYRINVINLAIPALRERMDDLELLVEHFHKKHAKTARTKAKRLSERCLSHMQRYNWPGNVRELENEVERLLVLSGEERTIDADLLSPRIRQHEPKNEIAGAGTRSLPDAVHALERRMILDALDRSGWNKTRAAAELEVSRRNLIRLVQKYELEPDRPT